MRSLIALIFLSLLLTSCGGGSSSNTRAVDGMNYSGEWALTYNVIDDQCGLLEEPDANAFDDFHLVTQTGSTILVQSDNLPLGEYEGEVRDDGSFAAGTEVSGDIFGDGSYCTLSEELSYNNAEGDVASSLYNIQIVCDDGFECLTVVRGRAERQVVSIEG